MFQIVGSQVNRIGHWSRAFFSVVVAITIAIATATGCAYHGGFGHRAMPGGYTVIAVPTFKNLTHDVGTEVYFTNAIIRELERSKVVKLTGKTAAQATLEGVIEKVALVPANPTLLKTGSFEKSNVGLTTSYEVEVNTRLTLRRNSDQSVLWEYTFIRKQSYSAPTVTLEGLNSADALYNHSARYQLISSLAQDMMAEAHDRLLESNW